MMPVPQLQLPNTAAQFLALQGQQGQSQAASQNAAIKLLKLQQEQRAVTRKEREEAYDYALNLFSSVNSEEDLNIAKKILKAKYPDKAPGVDAMVPDYDPRTIDLVKQSLRTQAQKIKAEERETELKGFGPGTTIFRGGKKVETTPFKPGEPDFEVFEGPGGEQVYVREGGDIPEGFQKVQGGGTSVTVNTGDLSPATKTQVQKDIIQAKQNIQSFKETRTKFKPEYLTLFGKGERVLASAMDKAGLSSEEQQELIRERAEWFRQAKSDFIQYRKWATGVAGGEKEMREIATAFPDPVKNSPTEYLANLNNIEETTKRILELNEDILEAGVDVDFGEEGGEEIPAEEPSVVIKFDQKGNRIQ